MLEIDGTHGEGGGQILRSSLALSLLTGTGFRIGRIRGRRSRPGLLAQHLTAVRAAATIGDARVEGDALGSSELSFLPGKVRPGSFAFDVGTAGSATLVLQTVLPALLVGDGTFELDVCGGTHNPSAPPYPFLEHAFLPLVRHMRARVEAELVRPGFFPAGGGQVRVRVTGVESLSPLHLEERGELRQRRATAVVAHLPRAVARRELAVVERELGFAGDELVVAEADDSRGPGNALWLRVDFEHLTEVVAAFGARGKPAERVAAEAVAEARSYLASDAAVGEHLADQLLLPLALAGGSFVTGPPSLHTRTNAEVIGWFLPVDIAFDDLGDGRWRLAIA